MCGEEGVHFSALCECAQFALLPRAYAYPRTRCVCVLSRRRKVGETVHASRRRDRHAPAPPLSLQQRRLAVLCARGCSVRGVSACGSGVTLR